MNLLIVTNNAALAVPTTAGVYAIRNTVSGATYIGAARDLRRRYRQWHRTLTSRHGANRLVLAALQCAPREAWRFVVLVDGPTMTDVELFALEQRAIQQSVQKGARLLNLTHTTIAGCSNPAK